MAFALDRIQARLYTDPACADVSGATSTLEARRLPGQDDLHCLEVFFLVERRGI
jgi:hypothetical protein